MRAITFSGFPVVRPSSGDTGLRTPKIQPQFGGDYFTTRNFAAVHDLPNASKTMYHTTGFFRDPELYNFLPNYLSKKFPEGVTLECWGASAGQEPYSLAMVLMKQLGLSPEQLAERYPIDASDIDETVVAMADQGMFGFSNADDDLDRMRGLGIDPGDYMIERPLSAYREREALFSQGDLGLMSHELKPNLASVWQIKPDLAGLVLFDVKDFTKGLAPAAENAPPRFVMIRNVLGHYKSAERRVLAEQLFDALPSGSAVVIGNWDFRQGVNAALSGAGFKQVAKSPADAGRFIFEKP